MGEQQLKRTQSGSKVEADAIKEHVAAEADAIGELQLKRMLNRDAAAEVDAIREQGERGGSS